MTRTAASPSIAGAGSGRRSSRDWNRSTPRRPHGSAPDGASASPQNGAFRHGQSPGGDLLGRKIIQPYLPQHRRRLPEQPTKLRDRYRLGLMQVHVLVDELTERGRTAPARAEARELLRKRSLRLALAGKPADLRPNRAASRS